MKVKVKVVSIETKQVTGQKGAYEAVVLNVLDNGVPGEFKMKKSFLATKNVDLLVKLSALRAGEETVLELETNGAFKNIKDVLPSSTVTDGNLEPAKEWKSGKVGAGDPHTFAKATHTGYQRNPKETHSIIRQNSLAHATQLVVAHASKKHTSAGGYEVSQTIDEQLSEVFRLAKLVEDYIMETLK